MEFTQLYPGYIIQYEEYIMELLWSFVLRIKEEKI